MVKVCVTQLFTLVIWYATPAGVANYIENEDYVQIWNIDASLDNYGGVQTPVLNLDFKSSYL